MQSATATLQPNFTQPSNTHSPATQRKPPRTCSAAERFANRIADYHRLEDQAERGLPDSGAAGSEPLWVLWGIYESIGGDLMLI